MPRSILTHRFALQRGPVVSLETYVLFDVGKAWMAGWKMSGVWKVNVSTRWKADEFPAEKHVWVDCCTAALCVCVGQIISC